MDGILVRSLESFDETRERKMPDLENMIRSLIEGSEGEGIDAEKTNTGQLVAVRG